jgi:hypothetical protein
MTMIMRDGGVQGWGRQLRANEDGVDSHPPRARVHLGKGVWLTLRAARIVETDEADADIAVTLGAHVHQ